MLLDEIQYDGGILQPGQGYDRSVTVTLPTGLVSGTYYLTAWADPYGTVLQAELATHTNPDDPNELQNDNYKAGNATTGGTEIIGAAVAPTLLPDVAVTAVTADPVGLATQPFTFSWTVKNNGPGMATETASSPWVDTVYLSDQPTLNAPGANVWTLGRYDRVNDLASGQSYTDTQTVTLNPAARGSYVFVVTSLASDTNSANNQGQTTTSVTGSVPDLQLVSVTTGGSVHSGEAATITYTVTNAGPGAIWAGTQYWSDDVYLSRDSTFIASRATLLGTVNHANTGLASGASYNESLVANVPPGIGGQFYIYVFVNQTPLHRAVALPTSGDNADTLTQFASEAYENPAHNTGSAPLTIVYAEADLVVSNVVVPATVTAGSTVQVTFTVTNAGTRATRTADWTDGVFLSLDASLDTGDDLLTQEQPDGSYVAAENRHDGVLAAGQSYTATVSFTVPFEVSGPFYVLVDTDTGFGASGFAPSTISPRLQGIDGNAQGSVEEFQGEGNNVTATAVNVLGYTAPDLVVSSVVAPTQVTLGSSFSVSYTVTDQGGSTPDLQSSWNDLVYLSADQFLDLSADRYVGSVRHTGGLAAGWQLQQHVDPEPAERPAGQQLLRVRGHRPGDHQRHRRGVRDQREQQQPRGRDADGDRDAAADRPAGGQRHGAGRPPRPATLVDVSWTVSDHSAVPASGNWTDAVYLSTDGTYSVDDKLLGDVAFSGTLNQGDSYTHSLQADAARRDCPEATACWCARTCSSRSTRAWTPPTTPPPRPAPITVAVPTLTIGSPLATTLLPGQQLLYQVQVPEGADAAADVDARAMRKA